MEEDISKLKIDRSTAVIRPRRGRKKFYWLSAIILIIVIAVLYLKGIYSPAVRVEVTNVVQMYPSQTFTMLNASGYVVAQRKAAVASKVRAAGHPRRVRRTPGSCGEPRSSDRVRSG